MTSLPKGSPDNMQVFDRPLLRQRRARAVANFDEFSFLFETVADQLADRLSDIRREFSIIADLGAGTSMLADILSARAGTRTVIGCDMAPAMARASNDCAVVADEDLLPFAPASLDAVVSNLSLQWVNDLPGALAQIRQALKPDGLFLAAIMGGQTLYELRDCLMQAEIEVYGGVSPRASPLIDMHDMSALMQRAGFALPVVDRDTIEIDYASVFSLMHDLRGMAATNATLARERRPVGRRLMLEAARLYADKYLAMEAEEGISATFEVIYMIGWAPAASQQQPLKPGSAKIRLADALGSEEKKI